MLGKLIPSGGGAPLLLTTSTVVVGRNRDCDIPIGCATVSSRHCELQLRDGVWWVRDLGSKNGTAVNGVKWPEHRIVCGDTLSIGRQRFILTCAPPEHAQHSAVQPPAADTPDVEAIALRLLRGPDEPAPATGGPHLSERRPTMDTPRQMPVAPPPTYLGKLVPCGGGDAIVLLRPDVTVGRRPSCDVCVRYPSVSAKHCQLTLRDGYWFVQDLNSSNGTWVDGVRCHRKCLLPDSVLGLAKYYRYTMHYTPQGSGPPPEDEADEVFSQGLLEKAGLAKLMKTGQLPGNPDDDDDSERRRYKLDAQDL
jgi:pSer/pThr/pTyr-binding forkhead associated (FHA) protein